MHDGLSTCPVAGSSAVGANKGYELVTFYFKYTTVVFNGRTGEPRFPAGPKGEGLIKEEREAVVAYAKRLLKQKWSAAPIPSHLRRKGWHLLPATVWKLATAVAYS